MKINPNAFPSTGSTFKIAGPAGHLEVAVAVVNDSTVPFTGVICHPHPVFGGTMNNKVVTTLARTFTLMGISSIRFNFRGVGESEGSFAEGVGESEDLLAVLSWLREVRPNHQIILAGFSFGAYVATRVASQWPAKQLITIAPPVNHFDFDSLTLPNYPWLVVQGGDDTVVPEANVLAWVNKQSIPIDLITLPGAGHFFHGRLVELRERLTDALIPLVAMGM
jgi:uncharacterized protein